MQKNSRKANRINTTVTLVYFQTWKSRAGKKYGSEDMITITNENFDQLDERACRDGSAWNLTGIRLKDMFSWLGRRLQSPCAAALFCITSRAVSASPILTTVKMKKTSESEREWSKDFTVQLSDDDSVDNLETETTTKQMKRFGTCQKLYVIG